MTNIDTLGIIFPNQHDQNLPELVARRAMGSIPFAGRYRMIDFCLSGMAGAGLQSIGIIARKNYQSLMDHLGSGREWDLSSKRSGLILYPPFARDGGDLYNGRIEALASIVEYMQRYTESLVVMSDCDAVFNLDYQDLLFKHRASGADITVVYKQYQLPPEMEKDNVCFAMDANQRITGVRVNEYKKGVHNLSLNVFVLGRQFLIDLVREATVRSEKDFIRDYIVPQLKKIHLQGYRFCGYSAHVYSMESYFKENMRLLNESNLAQLFFAQRPIYTKVRDEAPVRYGINAKAEGCLVADGCIIEGMVESSMLFRGVRIGKGAKVKNCVLMQGTVIGPGASIENVITDKNVQIAAGQSMRGAASFPVYVGKWASVG